MTNEERADVALDALKMFRAVCRGTTLDVPEGYEEGIGDLIGNLLHLAADHGLDPLDIVRHGISHYAMECVDDDGMYCTARVELDVHLQVYGGDQKYGYVPFTPANIKRLRKQAEKEVQS